MSYYYYYHHHHHHHYIGDGISGGSSGDMSRCPKSLEPMGILIIFLVSIYGLKLKFKKLKMALTWDERVEIVLNAGQGWTQRQVADEFNARHPELQTVVLLSIPICSA
jgi:hypothetical protein